MRKYIQNKGITLVSLIITVIILLILAGVGIGMFGENGLIEKSKEARLKAEIDEEKEIVETSVVQTVSANRYGNIEKSEVEIYLEKNAGDRETEVMEEDEVIIVEFKDSNRYYEIDAEGNVKKIDVIIDENPGNIKVGINGEELNGTAEKPYEIWCIEDLVEWSQNYSLYSTSTIKLCRTLNFTSKLSYSDSTTTNYGDINIDGQISTLIEEMKNGAGFTPIREFSGAFDGKGFEIKNMYMNTSNDAGLFDSISDATIENFGITGNIISGAYAGGIVSESYGASIINNCYSEVTIVAEDGSSFDRGTGGICGSIGENTIIQNCYNIGDITGNAGVGGIVGNAGGRIENCYNSGSIVSKATKNYNGAGGIAGKIQDKKIMIVDCYNTENAKVECSSSADGSRWNNR